MPRTLKLTLAYDGTAYAGWQYQPGQPTLQGALETALAKITGQPVRVAASGRTDAGVHALGQVVSFATDSGLAPAVLQKALNAELPRDIAVLDAAEAPPGFHAVRSAVRKRYRYTIDQGPIRDVFLRSYAWWIPRRLDMEAMRQAAVALVGRRDFRSFETTGSPRRTSVRTVLEISIQEEGENRIDVEIEADGFLYNMVRNIVGSLVLVGRRVRPPEWLAAVLAQRDRRAAGPAAPAQGLFLMRVTYGEVGSAGEPAAADCDPGDPLVN